MKSLSESINRTEKPTLKSHTHLQLATANAKPKIEKEYVFANDEKQADEKKPVYNNA